MIRSLGQNAISSCFHQSYQAHFGGTAAVSDIHQRQARPRNVNDHTVRCLLCHIISSLEDAVSLQEDLNMRRGWEKTRLINFHTDKYL